MAAQLKGLFELPQANYFSFDVKGLLHLLQNRTFFVVKKTSPAQVS